jgi:Tol biopolymer transport system component
MYSELALSPDGQKLAYEEGPSGGARSDVWIADLAHGGQFQLTSSGKATAPCWTPDGASVAYAAPAGDAILRQRADGGGAAEVLWRTTQLVPITLDSFAPDGSALLFTITGLPTRADIFLLPLSGERAAHALISTPGAETLGRISPNGRWIAYTGEYEAGQQIYAQAFPSLAGRWQLSRGGGSAPRWSRDGKELFYMSGDQMFVVPIRQEPTFSPGEPRSLFRIEQPTSSEWSNIYDVAPDGKRFIVLVRQKDTTKTPRIDVILNFDKRLAGAAP